MFEKVMGSRAERIHFKADAEEQSIAKYFIEAGGLEAKFYSSKDFGVKDHAFLGCMVLFAFRVLWSLGNLVGIFVAGVTILPPCFQLFVMVNGEAS